MGHDLQEIANTKSNSKSNLWWTSGVGTFSTKCSVGFSLTFAGALEKLLIRNFTAGPCLITLTLSRTLHKVLRQICFINS